MRTTLQCALSLLAVSQLFVLATPCFAETPEVTGSEFHATRAKHHRILVLSEEATPDYSNVKSERMDRSSSKFMNLASRGQAIIRTALQFRGAPYRFGGNSLTKGIDCSAFVRAIYLQYGINLPRVASQQFLQGIPVERERLVAGDLVFFQDTYKVGVSHVGFYIGEGNFVHASGKAKGVCVSSLDEAKYLKHWAGARRIEGASDKFTLPEEKPILEEMNSIEMIRDSSDEPSSSDSEALTPPVRVKDSAKDSGKDGETNSETNSDNDSVENSDEIVVQELQESKPVVRKKSSRKRSSSRKTVKKIRKSSGVIRKMSDFGSDQSIVAVASDTTEGERSEFEAFEIRRAARKRASSHSK